MRLDDAENPVGAEIRVTGRRSVASQVSWEPVCEGFARSTTVQAALDQLATARELRLLGGDGQQVVEAGATVPAEIRVVLDSPCGPVVDRPVRAQATDGALVARVVGAGTNPGTLVGSGATAEAEGQTDADGVAAFWWQPDVAGRLSDTLRVSADSAPGAPIQVTAHNAVAGGDGPARPPGVHIEKLGFTSRDFMNDDDITAEELAGGITVTLDEAVFAGSVVGKPVVRVVLNLPWPVPGDGEVWNPLANPPVAGFRHIEIESELAALRNSIRWTPTQRAADWLAQLSNDMPLPDDMDSVIGRLIIDGWAIVAERDSTMHVNGHARTAFDPGTGLTTFILPTDDEVTGGQFLQWFRLGMG